MTVTDVNFIENVTSQMLNVHTWLSLEILFIHWLLRFATKQVWWQQQMSLELTLFYQVKFIQNEG